MEPVTAALIRNVTFWFAYPELLLPGLANDQLRWQPEGSDNSITFATWHAYRAADDLCHGLVLGQPSVFMRGGWESRLPVKETGRSPFGNGLTRAQIGQLDLDPGALIDYAKAVGESINGWLSGASADELGREVVLPFFATVYPGYDKMSVAEAIMFFAIGHVSEHLGEVQLIKGMLGLQGAPL